DLEGVSVEALVTLAQQGVTVVPDPSLLERVTDKLKQKQWLAELDLPTAAFSPYDGEQPIAADKFGLPVVQKAARGGYDGRGVAVLHSEADYESRLRTPGYLEEFITRKMEVSVMVASDGESDIRAYQPVEMIFHEGGNVLDYLVAPARLDQATGQQAQDLAISAIAAMRSRGIFGIEMFLTEQDELLINEISPRTHNSGHYTTEACRTSQFEQQLRILCGQPLGDTEQLRPAAMFNLLGEPGYEGETVVDQSDNLSADDDVTVHLYGKKHCFAGRKMGHVTVTADSVDAALAKANTIRQQIRARGAQRID
ncbi:MAG: ATP-grasp domain-containing protein, partial [Gammaproteobacteria bacterium]|nr:ATP-grasp domain-containing protein [Gammaproteobacteria bacterium]